jgi:hypothetical protein
MPTASTETADQRITEGPVESLSADIDGGYTVNFACFRPDMDATPLLKGAPNDRCQCQHWGYVLEGQFDLPVRRSRRDRPSRRSLLPPAWPHPGR